jgi:Spy/CpxP family protein refolding chaperone
MKLNKLFLITLCGAAFLAVGRFSGAETPDGFGMGCHHGPPNLTAMLTHVLALTDAQKTQVQAAVEAVQPQLQAIHQQARAAAEPIMKQLHAQIRPILTADQQKKLDALETLHGSGAEGPPLN